jgi:myo-inositol-1(or 4)-monophosphatase
VNAAAEPRALLDLALSIAAEAGALIRDGRPERLGVSATKSSPTDIVTEMDGRSEELIKKRILTERPDDGILGEEGGERSGTTGVRWVIDPIDGTVNYLYAIPAWCVSIAVEVDGHAVAGVVTVPPLGETFYALHGGGAFLRRDGAPADPIRCRPASSLADALVATGFGYRADRRVLTDLLPRVRDIRRSGSAAYDICSVACGRVNGYFERGAQVWDYAAGALIAAEAGARVGSLNGAAVSPEMVVVAPEPVFGELTAALAALDAARD